MSPAVKNIVVLLGATFASRFLIDSEEGFAYDLTGYTVVAQIRESSGSRKKICDMTGVVNDAATGDFSISISAATTAVLKAGTYHWDCKLVSAGLVLYPLAGKAVVTQTVTR